MNEIEYDRMAEAEDSHWWFVHQRHLVHEVIAQLYGRGRPRFLNGDGRAEPDHVEDPDLGLDILDCACGTGAMTRELVRYGNVISLDVSRRAVRYARRKGAPAVVLGDGECLPLKNGTFDLAVTLHTLEHLDDEVYLRELFRVIRPSGRLVVTVPAFEGLRSDHDIALHHRRRYTAEELVARVAAAGFRVGLVSYTVMSLFPAIYAARWLQERLVRPVRLFYGREPKATVGHLAGPLNRALVRLLDWENRMLGTTRLPFGTGLVLTAERP